MEDKVDLNELKKLGEENQKLFAEFKAANEKRLAEVEKNGKALQGTENRVTKIGEELDKADKKFSDLLGKRQEWETGMARRLEELELAAKRPGAGGSNDEALRAERNEAIKSFALNGFTAENTAQIKKFATVEAKDTLGGFTSPGDYTAELIASIRELTPAFQLATVEQTGAKSVTFPTYTGSLAFSRTRESATRSATSGVTFGAEEITLPEAYCLPTISQLELEDSKFDLEAFLKQELAVAAEVLAGSEFVNGKGIASKEMEGVLSASLQEAGPSAAATISADEIWDLVYKVKDSYMRQGTFLLNRSTLKAIRKLKIAAGYEYVWAPGFADTPATIAGRPYITSPDMPEVAASATVLVFGDFKRAYRIKMRRQLTIQRLVELFAASGLIGLHATIRFGGQVVLKEALAHFTMKT